MLTAILAAITLAAGAAQAAGPRFPAVTDASFAEPDGDRVLRLSVEVDAPPAEVWKVWTTREGWESFAVRHARVDFRVDGVIETTYAPTFEPGGPTNIENVVVAYVPGRMLAMRNRKAPTGFAGAAEFARTVTVIELEQLGPARTRVTLSGVGFGSGPVFDDLYGKFAVGNAYTLDKLRQSFAPKP